EAIRPPGGSLDRQAAEDSIARLTDLGLLHTVSGAALQVNRLLAAFVRAEFADADAQMAVEEALLELLRPLDISKELHRVVPLQPHLRAVTDAASERGDERAAALCDALGRVLLAQGDDAGGL